MYIKQRSAKALLYRSTWVAKGTEGNTHGFARQHYVGSLALDATALPPKLAAKLTSAECEYVERQVLTPAREALARAFDSAEQRRLDPLWRLQECIVLVREAAELSAQSAVPRPRIAELVAVLRQIRCSGAPQKVGTGVEKSATAESGTDPLESVRERLDSAARAIAAGYYGPAPSQGVRATRVYSVWADIAAHLDGANEQGLLRQLQTAGWVKSRQRPN